MLDMPKRSHQVLPGSEKVCMYRKKHSIYRVQYYLQYQTSTGGLGTFLSWIRQDYCTEYIYLLPSYLFTIAVIVPTGISLCYRESLLHLLPHDLPSTFARGGASLIGQLFVNVVSWSFILLKIIQPCTLKPFLTK